MRLTRSLTIDTDELIASLGDDFSRATLRFEVAAFASLPEDIGAPALLTRQNIWYAGTPEVVDADYSRLIKEMSDAYELVLRNDRNSIQKWKGKLLGLARKRGPSSRNLIKLQVDDRVLEALRILDLDCGLVEELVSRGEVYIEDFAASDSWANNSTEAYLIGTLAEFADRGNSLTTADLEMLSRRRENKIGLLRRYPIHSRVPDAVRSQFIEVELPEEFRADSARRATQDLRSLATSLIWKRINDTAKEGCYPHFDPMGSGSGIRFRSLTAAMWFHLAESMAGGFTVEHCEYCGRSFVKTRRNHNKKNCRDSCRNKKATKSKHPTASSV